MNKLDNSQQILQQYKHFEHSNLKKRVENVKLAAELLKVRLKICSLRELASFEIILHYFQLRHGSSQGGCVVCVCVCIKNKFFLQIHAHNYCN